jgi:ABC-type transport system involved in multi-copper enzyme maturation permease subunit
MPELLIARLTLFEALRRRLVLAVVLLTPCVVACTGWGFARMSELKDNGGARLDPDTLQLNYAVLVILIAFMFSVVLAVGAIFLAAPSIAADIESGLVLAILPRPIRRGSVFLGKWLGLALLLISYTSVTASLELLMIARVTSYVPPHPVLAVAFIVWQSLVMLSLTLAVSTRLAPMTGGVIIVVVFGLTWIVGIAQTVGQTFHNAAIERAGSVVSYILPSDQLWRGAVYNLEPPRLRALGLTFDPLAVGGSPSVPFMAWAVAWIVGALALGIWSLNRRDL